jgi:hypothetical protein
VDRLQFAPDSTRLVTASESEVRMWDVASSLGRTLPVDHTVDELRFAPEGLSIAVLARGHVHVFPDDLPTNAPALRAWLEQATSVTIPAPLE